jgi:glyoxylase-like metal-dependent hydrolase (beta-lactamase superfamily II)
MIELTPLTDFEGSFATYREAFAIDDDAPWVTSFRSYVVRSGEWTAIVDTGVGPPGEDPFLPERDGRLPEALRAANVVRETVDAVLLTHLHPDHVGWNMHEGAPFFPSARYVAHVADFEYFAQNPQRPYIRDQLLALRDAGVLDLLDADRTEVHGGVTMELLAGHTPGHCVIDIDDGPLLLGDLVVHELQLHDLGQWFSSEGNAEETAAARRRVVPELADSGRLVGLPHLPHGLGRIRRDGDGYAWQPLD